VKKITSTALITFVITALSVVFLYCQDVAGDDCKASFINPFTDVRWDSVFPIELAGVKIKGPADLDNPDTINSIVCACKKGAKLTLGLTVSYWEPSRIIETTKTPWCLPTLGGLKLSGSDKNLQQGSHKDDTQHVQANAHWYVFSVWQILDLFMDVPCVPIEGFDLAYLTEIDPTWNNDLLSFILNPEALLFGNPAAQMACMADSVSSSMGWPLDPLFWCMGSWGNSYPLSGDIAQGDYISANAGLAGRMVYKMHRELLAWDPGVDKCGAVLTPIWIKSHYKVHQIKPVRGAPMPIGRAGLLWETNKNPPYGAGSNSPDNFSWMFIRRVKCCIGRSF